MRKLLLIHWSLLPLLLLITSCSDDDSDSLNDNNQYGSLGLKSAYSINRLQVLDIILNPDAYPESTFEWVIQGKTTQEDSLFVSGRNLSFASLYPGTYSASLNIKNGTTLIRKEQTYITVIKETYPYSAYIAKVYDYLPAVGQFTNDLPLWSSGDSRETMIAKANQSLVGANPSMISLGGYGGYVVFGFDHTVINIEGKRDFKILGNAFWNQAFPGERAGSIEPGIILVSYDKNKNGVPDDEWYEIAGSEYNKNSTIKGYEITYEKPDPSKAAVPGTEEWLTDIEYIKWKDNQGNSGYKSKTSFHSQSYYPEWISSATLTFTGTRLENNFTLQNGTWVGKSYEYGYADNAPNNDEASNIDIDWAVDKNGNKVKLPGIDFVKVYTGVNQEAGAIGEVSTEVAGAYDLHLLN